MHHPWAESMAAHRMRSLWSSIQTHPNTDFHFLLCTRTNTHSHTLHPFLSWLCCITHCLYCIYRSLQAIKVISSYLRCTLLHFSPKPYLASSLSMNLAGVYGLHLYLTISSYKSRRSLVSSLVFLSSPTLFFACSDHKSPSLFHLPMVADRPVSTLWNVSPSSNHFKGTCMCKMLPENCMVFPAGLQAKGCKTDKTPVTLLRKEIIRHVKETVTAKRGVYRSFYMCPIWAARKEMKTYLAIRDEKE